MAWFTHTVLELDAERARIRRTAAFEESVRLAMWRMESTAAPVVARESARPYFTWTPFYPAGRAYTQLFARLKPGDVLFPSPLLSEVTPYVRLRFQFAPDGVLTSPRAPAGNMRDLAESGYLTHEEIDAAGALLERVSKLVSRDVFLALLPPPEPVPLDALPRYPAQARRPSLSGTETQQVLNDNEWAARNVAVQQAANPPVNEDSTPEEQVVTGMMRPLWAGGGLFLMRRVSVGGSDYVQGAWLEWSVLREMLLESIRALLPEADLVPVAGGTGEEDPRMLAALPARLLPGEPPAFANGEMSPLQVSLLVAWVGVLLALIAGAVLLGGAMALSERRSAFVSAVTHELRTPLTTFRMYTEMLDEGMVGGPEEKAAYLRTLRTEAERLAHLVENVLAYARLEKSRAGGAVEAVSVAELLDRTGGTLADRAGQAGMTLDAAPEGFEEIRFRADLPAVERILFNLVDNSCKYAQDAQDRRIHLAFAHEAGLLAIRVSDHGPGVAPGDRRKLFSPFTKASSGDAASRSGLGLGLSLSRRLACKMGGDLRFEEAGGGGARFVLVLPTCDMRS